MYHETKPTGKNATQMQQSESTASDTQARDFSDPVYKHISRRNGVINKMTVAELRQTLRDHHLDPRGCKDVLKKRLKSYQTQCKLVSAKGRPDRIRKPRFNYLLVIDYEATCEQENSGFKHEIIEFPVIMVDTKTHQVVDHFHSYVRPTLNPKLSTFCKELTGITQEQVDESDRFPVVLSQFSEWLTAHEMGEENGNTYAVVTDGPWDMARFLYTQCKLCHVSFPEWGKQWINIRKTFSNYYGVRQTKLQNMLDMLGMEFEGNLHSGIDDSRNIARIAIRMLLDGCDVRVNERLFRSEDSIRDDSDTQDSLVECVSHDANEQEQHHQRGQQAASNHRYQHHGSKSGAHRSAKCKTRNPKPEREEPLDPRDYQDLLTYYSLQKS